MDISGLHFYSYGVSVENKPLSNKELRVVPLESVPFVEGEVAENDEEITVSGVDRLGNSYTSSTTSSNAITATWLPWGSNRATPPDIRRGERIIVLQYMNVDEYFWIVDGRDENLRRLETVIYRYSNTRDEGEVTITDDNSWSLTVSTHEKHITLRTTKNDGEPFAYTFQINAKEGNVLLTDDVGNFFELNSKDTVLTLKNIDDTHIELNKKILNIHALDEINIKTKTMNVDTETTNETATTINTKAEDINVEASAIVIQTDTMDTTAPTNSITGTTTHEGAMTVTGAMTMGGGFSSTGGSGGSIEGNLTNNGVDVGSQHVHPKGPTSQPDTFPPKS